MKSVPVNLCVFLNSDSNGYRFIIGPMPDRQNRMGSCRGDSAVPHQAPAISYLGSSNLTLAGLSKQGELNVDILDHDACAKLEKLVRRPEHKDQTGPCITA